MAWDKSSKKLLIIGLSIAVVVGLILTYMGLQLYKANLAEKKAYRDNIKCKINMLEISLELASFYSRNNQYPDNFSAFMQSIKPTSLYCPAKVEAIKQSLGGQATAKDLAPAAYLYWGKNLHPQGRVILLSENVDNHPDGVYLLYNDLAVEKVPAHKARDLLETLNKGIEPQPVVAGIEQ